MENLVSSEDGKFTIVSFYKNYLSGDFQESIGEIAMPNMDRIQSVSYISLDKHSDHEYNFETIFNIKKYPQIIVFDNKGTVLKTNKVEDLKSFFENLETY